MRVAAVGGGITSLCPAWGLARLRRAVTLLAQGRIPDPLAASGDHHGIIRRGYAHPGYRERVTGAAAAWDLLWAGLGARHLGPRGFAGPGWTGAPSGAPLSRPRAARSTAWRSRGAWRPGSARAEVREGAARAVGDGRVAMRDGALEAGRVLACAGAWTPGLMPGIAPRLRSSRTAVAYLEPPPDLRPARAAAAGAGFVRHEEGATLAVSACADHGHKFGAAVGLRVARAVARGGAAGLARWLAA